MESLAAAMQQRVSELQRHSMLGMEAAPRDETLHERVARLERIAERIKRGDMRFKPGYAEM